MEIKIKESVKPAGKGQVIIASDIKRERELLDKDGNVIDMRTKQIIKPADNK